MILAENDLFERADSDLVERLFAAASEIIALDCLPTRTTARADITDARRQPGRGGGHLRQPFRPRAARSSPPSRTDATAAWRVIAALMPTPSSWAGLDDILADMANALPTLPAPRAPRPMPASEPRSAQVARAPWRMSGRTAHDRAGRVADGVPPEDPDCALAFSMEGAHGRTAPPALLTGYETPGLHSASGSWRFIDGPERRAQRRRSRRRADRRRDGQRPAPLSSAGTRRRGTAATDPPRPVHRHRNHTRGGTADDARAAARR